MNISEEGFYEDDEPLEELLAAWKTGDGGFTSGSRYLNQPRVKVSYDQDTCRRCKMKVPVGARMGIWCMACVAEVCCSRTSSCVHRDP